MIILSVLLTTPIYLTHSSSFVSARLCITNVLVRRLALQPIDLTAKTFTLAIQTLIKIVEGNKKCRAGACFRPFNCSKLCVFYIKIPNILCSEKRCKKSLKILKKVLTNGFGCGNIIGHL